MTVEELTSLDADEMAELVGWRTEMLSASGFGADDASLLARRVDVSVYEAIRIVSEGAEHAAAVETLV